MTERDQIVGEVSYRAYRSYFRHLDLGTTPDIGEIARRLIAAPSIFSPDVAAALIDYTDGFVHGPADITADLGVRVEAEAVAALLIGDDKENVGLVFKHGHSS